MLMYHPSTITVKQGQISGTLVDIEMVYEKEQRIHYVEIETGEILWTAPYFRKQFETRVRSNSNYKEQRWRWFCGCNSVEEVKTLNQRLLKYLDNQKIHKESVEYLDYREEYVKALSSPFPLQNLDTQDGDWIGREYAEIVEEGKSPTSLWFMYELKVLSGVIKGSLAELEQIRGLLGYKRGWVYFKAKELKLCQ